jgi:acyl carrier protein
LASGTVQLDRSLTRSVKRNPGRPPIAVDPETTYEGHMTMVPAMILDQIRATMGDVFDVDFDEASVTADTTANDIEEWDSLSHIRLIVAIERRFKVKFKNSEIESVKKVGDLVALVQAKAA